MSDEVNLIILMTLDRMLTYIYTIIFFVVLLIVWSIYLTYKVNKSSTSDKNIKSKKHGKKKKTDKIYQSTTASEKNNI